MKKIIIQILTFLFVSLSAMDNSPVFHPKRFPPFIIIDHCASQEITYDHLIHAFALKKVLANGLGETFTTECYLIEVNHDGTEMSVRSNPLSFNYLITPFTFKHTQEGFMSILNAIRTTPYIKEQFVDLYPTTEYHFRLFYKKEALNNLNDIIKQYGKK